MFCQMSDLDENEEEEQRWWIITVKSYKIFQSRWGLPEEQKNLWWWGLSIQSREIVEMESEWWVRRGGQ